MQQEDNVGKGITNRKQYKHLKVAPTIIKVMIIQIKKYKLLAVKGMQYQYFQEFTSYNKFVFKGELIAELKELKWATSLKNLQ